MAGNAVTYHNDPEVLVLEELDSRLAGAKAIYVAVPITSGKRLWDLASRLGESNLDCIRYRRPKEFEQEVFHPNCVEARSFAEQLARLYPGEPVIDPSVIDIPGWGPEEYSFLWKQVLRTRVRLIALTPGWAYSKGCVEECVDGLRLGMLVQALDGMIVEKSTARRVLEKVNVEAKELGIQAPFLDVAIQNLSDLG